MHEFIDDDEGYHEWVAANPEGLVLNLRRLPDPNYVILHRATCRTISKARPLGAYTARGYRKVVSREETELAALAGREGRPDCSFSSRCGLCKA